MARNSVRSKNGTPAAPTRRIYESILALIRDGDLRPGDRLPNERELASQLDTGRAPLRNALSIAENDGLIVRHVGSGTFLTDNAASILEIADASVHYGNTESITFHEIMEARLMFEPLVAGLAAVHATKRDLAEMDKELLAIRGAESWLVFKKAIYRLLQCIYVAGHNRFMQRVFEQIAQARQAVQFDGRKPDKAVSELVREHAQKELSVIVDAIRAHNRPRAEHETKAYLTRILANIAI